MTVMKRMTSLILHALVLMVLMAASNHILAEPVISGIKGTTNHGVTVTVVGTGFGEKTTAAPLVYDTVEGRGFHQSWESTFGLSVSFDNNRHRYSTQNGHFNFTSSNPKNAKVQAKSRPLSAKWFCQFWVKLGNNWDWGTTTFKGANKFLANIKIFRLWNPGSTSENIFVQYEGATNEFKLAPEGIPGESSRSFFSNASSRFSRGSWHLLQFVYSENSTLRAANGVFKFWFDGELFASHNNVITRTSIANTTDGANLKRPYIIGFENEWNSIEDGGGGMDSSDNAPNDFYMDDIYLDNSWARIEIGSHPTYSACRHREIQIPTQWTASSISFTANIGSFAIGSIVYLYVVDSNGIVNATGFPLTIGKRTTLHPLEPEAKLLNPSQGESISFGGEAVELVIHDARGDIIATRFKTGSILVWDGSDDTGRAVPAGYYVSKIKGEDGTVHYAPILVVR